MRAGNRVGLARKETKPPQFLAELRPQEPQIRCIKPLDTSPRP